MKSSSSLVLMMMFLFFISCSDNPPPYYGVNTGTGYHVSYRIVEADSCEYIKFNTVQDSWGGHRARCKYCLQRKNNK